MGEFDERDSESKNPDYPDKSYGRVTETPSGMKKQNTSKENSVLYGVLIAVFVIFAIPFIVIYSIGALSAKSYEKREENQKEKQEEKEADYRKEFTYTMLVKYNLEPDDYTIDAEHFSKAWSHPVIEFVIKGEGKTHRAEWVNGSGWTFPDMDNRNKAPTLSPIEIITEPVRDLNGLEVTLVDWWSYDNWNEANNAYEEAYWDMQNEAMKKYNYTFKRSANGSWRDEWYEEFLVGVSENNPMGSIVTFDYRWVASLITTGAFLDVSKLPSIDWNDQKFNRAVIDVMSCYDGIYGFATGLEPRTGVFFNKALLKDAGIDEELPYDLQASGKWTFAVFEEICKTLTRDTNNDGVTDVYGVTGQSTVFFQGLLIANDTYVITKENGRLVMNANDRKVLEALNFGHELIAEGCYSPRGDADWDYFKTDFYEGRAAMYVEEMYACDRINDKAPDMDYGFVNIPKGPSAKDYVSVCHEDILVMPNCEKVIAVADDIAFAYDIFTSVPELYREEDIRWKSNLENRFRDNRSVYETCNWMINKWDPYMAVPDVYISGFSPDWLFNLGEGRDPQETVDAYSREWQTQVDEFNRKLK